jgi:hypothetical protein
VLDAFIVVRDHAFPKGIFGNDFSDVFEDEVARPEIGVCTQAISFLLGLDD